MHTLLLLCSAASLMGCTGMPAPDTVVPAGIVAQLAPTGVLRAAINLGNPILASRDSAGAAPYGVSVDLAQALGRRLGVPVQLVTYDAAGKVVSGLKAGQWDVGFVAIDPVRAADMAYTAPYIVIEGAYLVARDSPIRDNSEVDRAGNRIVVGAGSAYDLYLTRAITHAQLVRAPTSPKVTDMLVAQSLEVAAGVRQQLEADARRTPGVRLLAGRFMEINQAMAAPRGHPEAMRVLAAFVEEMKATGFVARALVRHRIEGAQVAPAGPVLPGTTQ